MLTLHYTGMATLFFRYFHSLMALPGALAIEGDFMFYGNITSLRRNDNRKAGETACRTMLPIVATMLGMTCAAIPAVRVTPAVNISMPLALGIGAASGLALVAALLAYLLHRLLKEKHLLNELFEQAPQAVALTAMDDRVIRVNKGFTQVFGYTPQAAAGRRLSELIVPAESHEEYRKQAASVAQGHRVDAEGVRCRQDGSRFPAAITLAPFSSFAQETAVYAMHRDITKRQLAEDAWRAGEGRWRAVFDNSAVGIAVTDTQGKFVATNRAYRALVGYSEEELRAMSYMDLTWEEDRPPNAAPAADKWAGRLPHFQLEKRYRRKDGQSIWVRVTASTSPGDGTTPPFGIGIVEDITARKQAEATLQRYQHAVETFHEMIAVVDRDYRYVMANRAFLNYHGLKRKQVIGHFFADLVGQETFEKVTKSNVDQCFQGRAVRGEMELDFPHLGRRVLDGSYFPVDGPGGVDRVAVVLLDITEQKRAKRELQHSFQELHALNARLQNVREEERTRLSRELHDQLGQALTAIKIGLAALKTAPGRDRQLQRIDTVLGLVDETILSVRRISTELRPGILDDVGLVGAVEWAAEEFQAHTGIQCQVRVPETNLPIDAERTTALFRIFQETLTNIARHAGATHVRIGLFHENCHVLLEVRDNGRGIGEGQLSGPGSLGILGMRERAELLGGEFTIAGEPGSGTTVRVRIPCAGHRRAEAHP